MFDDYKVVWCSKCEHSIFPQETAPWGTCSIDRKTICKTVCRTCNKFDWKKGKGYGKDKQRSNYEALQRN